MRSTVQEDLSGPASDNRLAFDETKASFQQELSEVFKSQQTGRSDLKAGFSKPEGQAETLVFTALAELEVSDSKPRERRAKKPYTAEKLPERKVIQGESASVGSNEKDLPNFHKVDEHLYRGGEPGSKEALEKLKAQGVTTVIDFRGPIPMENVPDDMKDNFEKKNQRLADHQKNEREWCKELGLSYVSIPMTSGEGPSEEQINQFLELAQLEQEEQGKIFAHDEHGSDREGAMMYTYRIAISNFTPQQAREEMLKYSYRQRENGTDVYENMTGTIEDWANDYLEKRQKK